MEHDKESGVSFTEDEVEVGSLFYSLIAKVGKEMIEFVIAPVGSGRVRCSASGLRCILVIAEHMRLSGLVLPSSVADELNRLANEAEQKAMGRALQRVTVRVPNNGRVQ